MVADNNPKPDRKDLSVRECLQEALKDFEAGEVPMRSGNKPTKVVVMFLDDSPGEFETKVLDGSDGEIVRCSTLVSLMELYKYTCLKRLTEDE